MSLLEYVTSSQFAVDVAENWQSEYLQFLLYILLTVWLVQRGSPESKPLDQAGRESDKDQKVGRYAETDSPAWAKAGGWRLPLFSRSLGLVMGAIFCSRGRPSSSPAASPTTPNRSRTSRTPLAWVEYLVGPGLLEPHLPELAVRVPRGGSMVVLSIYLRERGSPESKPVGQPHTSTGVEG